MDLHFQLMGDLKVLENLTGKASIVSTRVAKNDGKARKTGSHTHSNIISILEQPETKSGCCTSQSRKQQLRRSDAERSQSGRARNGRRRTDAGRSGWWAARRQRTGRIGRGTAGRPIRDAEGKAGAAADGRTAGRLRRRPVAEDLGRRRRRRCRRRRWCGCRRRWGLTIRDGELHD